MISRGTKRWAIPLALAVAYVAVLAITAGLSSRPTQPLFEGVGPTAPYRWVKPPSEFASTNQPPGTLDSTVAVNADGSAPMAATSHDGQIVVNLGAGAVAPAEGATDVNALGTPLDPATLGALPAPLRTDGNAYRVDFTYKPTNAGASIAKPGNLVLVVPEAADAIYYSTDGSVWEKRPTQTVGGASTVGTTLDKPGFYLAGTTASPSSSGGSSSWNSVLVVAGTALVGLALVLIPAWIWRRRSATSNQQQSRQVRRATERKRTKNTKRR